MTSTGVILALLLAGRLHVKFPENVMPHVELLLRWLHIVAGITWVGLLYFFNLVNVPLMKELDAPTRGKLVPKLMPRALWWFRWGAVVTVLAGFLYFSILMHTDAANAGNPGLVGRWTAIWFLVWAAAWGILYAMIRPAPANANLYALMVVLVVAAASYGVLSLIAHPGASNRTLSISVGGGMGLLMLLNVWGVIWRAQKRIIAWTQANAEQGTPIPAESARLGRMAFLASRTNAWLSLPMLFFMAASNHYPFLSGK
jgi:uncharacterized membrane protein